MALSRQVAERYLRTEAEEIATIAGREVALAMKPGDNVGFKPELQPFQIENATVHMNAYPANSKGSQALEAEMKRALRNWGVMYRAHIEPTRSAE